MKNDPNCSPLASSSIMETLHSSHYIHGRWFKGEGPSLISRNPATNQIIWQGNSATKAEVSLACESAHKAFPSWAFLDVETRANHLKQFAKQIETQKQKLTLLIAEETGKPLWEAMTETTSVINKINLSIQAYHERTSEQRTATSEGSACLRFKPHGVIAVLGPFNFPAHLSNGHIVPALLAGNTIVYKPSELTPAVAQLIIQCWHESGLPPGVINCVQGDASCGKWLIDTDIQGVFFTGSYKTGQSIHQQFANRPEIILALEMGGSNPLIVDRIQNIEAAIYSTLLSTLLTAGQRCTCARRILIADNADGDHYLSRLITAFKKVKVSSFTAQPEPFMGPVISHQHALTHLKTQQELIQLGGKALLTLSLLTENTGLLSPGIIDMTAVSNAPDEEIFAPLVQIYRYKDFNQALMLANQTRYGLAAGLLSDNLNHYQQFYQTIRAGIINWNRPTTGALSSLPFGGIGCSGNHRPSAYFAADYCAYPIANLEQPHLLMPSQTLPGIDLT